MSPALLTVMLSRGGFTGASLHRSHRQLRLCGTLLGSGLDVRQQGCLADVCTQASVSSRSGGVLVYY